MRIEVPESQGLAAAQERADEVAATLPRFAGVAHKDPRAPQNLLPIGALERRLRHQLGPADRAARAVRLADRRHPDHLRAMTDQLSRIGAVDGSTEAGTRRFHVVLDDDATVQLDDLVVCRQTLPDGSGEVAHYGHRGRADGRAGGRAVAVGHAARRRRHDAGRGRPPRRGARAAHGARSCGSRRRPGAVVHAARGAARTKALFVDQMRKPLAVGLDQSGEPVHADFTFINGEQGGHVSISGISGVAAKTSYALFLLYMIFETAAGRSLLGEHAASTKALVFNVKGEDLLHLDRPNRLLRRRRSASAGRGSASRSRGRSGRSRSTSRPLAGGDDAPGRARRAASRSSDDVHVYGWTPEAFIRDGLLRFCFTEGDDRSTQVGFVEQVVRTQLARHAHPLEGEDGRRGHRPHAALHVADVRARRRAPRAGEARGRRHADPRRGTTCWTCSPRSSTRSSATRRGRARRSPARSWPSSGG